MYRIVLATLMVFGFAMQGVLAQEQPPGGGDTSDQDRPWYSMFTDNRSSKFDGLRQQRLELSRSLNALEAEVRDLRQKNTALDESIKAARLRLEGGARTIRASSVAVQELAEQKKRAEFEAAQLTERFTTDLESRKAEVAELEKKLTPTPEEQTRLQNLRRDLLEMPAYMKREADKAAFEANLIGERIAAEEASRAEEEEARAAELKSQQDVLDRYQAEWNSNAERIVKATTEIASLYAKIDTIDAEILKLIDVGDTDGWFKIIISLSFALLVAGVIVGFYWVIGKRPQIIDEIFSNDSGIQFITIFSIVIAVILFGIIGVLEGKELSALLGGLSGFILGRNAAKSAAAKPADIADQPERPVQPPAGAAPVQV